MPFKMDLSAETRQFVRECANKIFVGEMVYCSTTKDGMEIWHETKCQYHEGKIPGVACKNFMESAAHKKTMADRAPRFLSDWERGNFGISVFDFNKTHLVMRTDNKQFNFEIEGKMRDELIDEMIATKRYAVFTPLVAVPAPSTSM